MVSNASAVIRVESAANWHNRSAVSAFAFRFSVEPSLAASLTTSSISLPTTMIGATDVGSSRLVYAMVIGLVVVGLAFVLLGVWLIRQTRTDLEVLAPLERMGDGDWTKRDIGTGRFMDRKADAKPFKGVTKEK